MEKFAVQLTAARKAAGMTQEELSAAVHVARNTISNWENGRTQPDLDTVRLLGQVLHTDFLSGENAGKSQDSMPLPGSSAENVRPSSSRVSGKRLFLICAAATVIAIAAIILLLIHNARISKTAVITLTPLENPAPMIVDPAFEPDGLGWEFTFVATNESDIPFRPNKAMMHYYKGDAITERMELDYAFLRGCMENDRLTREDAAPMHINWGASYPLFTSVELVLQGTDDNGHKLEIRSIIELSQEKPDSE